MGTGGLASPRMSATGCIGQAVMMWRKPDRSADSLGPAWRDVRASLEDPERRKRVFRWATIAVVVVVAVAVVGSIFLSVDARVSSWGVVAAVAIGTVAIVLSLARLVLGSRLLFEIGRGAYRCIAEKRRHRAWSKQAAQRSLFKR